MGLLLAILATWKVYVSVADVSKFVLPPPDAVWDSMVDLLGRARTWHHIWVTSQEILLGFGLALVGGLAVGVAIGEMPVLDRAMNPFLVALQVLPKVAIIPLLILWMGFGLSAKVVVAAVFAFFPITAGTRAGIRAVEPGHRDLAATLRASRWQRLRFIVLPSALPSILTGMEVGVVLATIGAVVAEYLAGGEGLGWLAVASLNQLQVADLFAVIILLAVLGFVAYAAITSLRRILVPWHPSAEDRPPGF
jgi:NitT/TauT family transport system permease protein